MIDIIIIKLLFNKIIYNKYNHIINLEFYKNNNKELFKVFTSLFQLHEKTTADVTIQDLSLFFYTLYPLVKPEEKVLFDTIFDQVGRAEASEDVALEYLEKHRQQTLATSIAIAALDVSRGKGDLGTVIEMLAQESVTEVSDEQVYVSDDLDLLAEAVHSSSGLRWRLETMNKTVGSLRKGDFGFIFARPETGKTTFLASEISYMAEQTDNPILWCNNEEQGSKVMLRCYQAVFGITQQELFSNLDYYKDEYEKRIRGRIKIFDEATITKKKVERLCEELNPSMIIFDQIDKVAWPDSERYDLKMKSIYQWGRELSKTYGPTVGVCQAGGTGEGKKYLTMNDVDSSHTAKQGEADFMIGIGKTNDDAEEYVRYISICKNKLAGDMDTIPELRHGKVSVIIDPHLARYRDSMVWK
jgi:replicative DNA helicase